MPIDISALKGFDVIFIFLLVLIVLYALLQKIKFLGENKGIHVFIAFILALLAVLSPIVVRTLLTAAPWFVLFLFLIIFLLIAFMTLGAKEQQITDVLRSKQYGYVRTWVWAIVLIIALGSLSFVITQEKGGFPGYGDVDITNGSVDGPPTQQQGAFWSTLFHPKVLGFITILIIAMFTVGRLTEAE